MMVDSSSNEVKFLKRFGIAENDEGVAMSRFIS